MQDGRDLQEQELEGSLDEPSTIAQVAGTEPESELSPEQLLDRVVTQLTDARREQLRVLGDLGNLVDSLDPEHTKHLGHRSLDLEQLSPSGSMASLESMERLAGPLLERLYEALRSPAVQQLDRQLGSRFRIASRLGTVIDKIAFWDAGAAPAFWRNYIVWKSKRGPRKHQLALPTSNIGRAAWARARARKPSNGLHAKLKVLTVERSGLTPFLEGRSVLQQSSRTEWQKDLEQCKPDVVLVDLQVLSNDCAEGGHILDDIVCACESSFSMPVVWVDAPSLARGQEPGLRVPRGVVVLVDSFSTAQRLAKFEGIGSPHVIGAFVDTRPLESAPPTPHPSVLLCDAHLDSSLEAALRDALPDCDVRRWTADSSGQTHDSALAAQLSPTLTVVASDIRQASSHQLEQLGRALATGAVLLGQRSKLDSVPPPWNAVPFTSFEDPTQLADAARGILNNADARHREAHRSVRFARQYLSAQAAFQRFACHAGMPMLGTRPRLVSVLCVSNRPQRIRACLETYRRQTYHNKELIFVANVDHLDDEWVEQFIEQRSDVTLVRTNSEYSLGESLNRARAVANGDVWTKLDDDDYYGDRYLEDIMLALENSGAAIVGKGTFFSYVEGQDELYLTPQAPENAFSDRYVHGGTITADRRLVESIDFLPVKRGTDSLFLQQCKLAGLRIYSADRYNFTYIRYQAPGHHTFDVANQVFLETCQFIARGFDKSLVDL